MEKHFQKDIDAVQKIGAVPTILDVICSTTGMGFAAVARVTEDRWIACQVLDNVHFGLPAGGELKVETTLCHEIRQHHNLIVIDNVAEDAVYANHHTPEIYGLQSYISVPIILPDGSFFGTLCAIDPKPHKLSNPATLSTFKLFAELIAYHLDADAKLTTARIDLIDAHAAAELREQFIAVLGHDLRNPLAAISSGGQLLSKEPQTEKAQMILRLMRGSVLRMSVLIDNVMDFARGRLGGGIGLNIVPGQPLAPTLQQVISEIVSVNADRRFDIDMDLSDDFHVDHGRIGQMLSNMLGNAVSHGSPEEPIRIHAFVEAGHLHLSVANSGSPIPDAARAQLFQPFSRGAAGNSQQGLGLGLYIASQIAEAHGGKLEVHSDEQETTFTFTMPVEPAT
jgi:signal transduction histidine kinase